MPVATLRVVIISLMSPMPNYAPCYPAVDQCPMLVVLLASAENESALFAGSLADAKVEF